MYGRPNWRWPGRIRTSHGRVIRIITYNVLGLQGYPPGEALEADAVVGHCLTNLAKFKVPSSVEFIEALPRNATGKVLKRNLRDMYVDEGTAAIT